MANPSLLWPARVAAGHPRTIAALACGIVAYAVLPHALGRASASVLAWDVAAAVLVALSALLFMRGGDRTMAANAMRQLDGEWTMFAITLGGIGFSFVALVTELSSMKELQPGARDLHVGLVGATLLLSWLTTHVVFTLRYAHEYYTTSPGGTKVDGGLEFPGDETPDYWDFFYFAIVLGMTFQVSDVDITSKKLRRLATVHGLISFLFNTVIVALTVNAAAGLLG